MKRFASVLLLGALLGGCASGGAPFFEYMDDGQLDPKCPAAKVEAVASAIPIYGSAAVAAIGLVGTVLHLGVQQAKKTAADASAKIDDHVEADHSSDGNCATCGGSVTVTRTPPPPAS
jgi:outer membrane murein-binding lipoprotein Lpp